MKDKKSVELAEQVIPEREKSYPLVTFRRHKHTGKIHLFSSRRDGSVCSNYEESYCSRISENPVKIEDTESLSNMNLRIRGRSVSVKSFACKEKDWARIIAALLQNDGYDVCGVCVSHLYHKEDEE
jgi:hypothetical protein